MCRRRCCGIDDGIKINITIYLETVHAKQTVYGNVLPNVFMLQNCEQASFENNYRH